MATVLLGGLAAYVLYRVSQGTGNGASSLPTPQDVADAFQGDQDVQRAYWYGQPFSPQNYGKPPFALRRPRPDIMNTTALVDEDYQYEPQDELEYRRQQIEDTEPEEVAFRGYRATYYAERERRRVPFFNNPSSGYTAIITGAESSEVYPIVQPRKSMPNSYDF